MIVKDQYNDSWNLNKFTKPNGSLERGNQNQLTFVPKLLPPVISYDKELIMLLALAERKVGELKGKGSELGNLHIFIRAYLKREAVLSSKIEGTLASLEDLNKHEIVGNIGQNVAEKLRLYEVINYVNALDMSLNSIRKVNQSVNLDIIKKAHKILMTDVRGQDKNSGDFRTQQNWIVKTRGTKKTIIYTPPPHEKILGLLKNLEEFIQTDHREISALIKCAIIHYQFESIHPFLDGNGRIGRLLLPLILYKTDLLPEPLLYLSAYFDKHREEYYGGLLAVSQKSKWREWIKFFLRGFVEQADETIKNIQKLVELEKKYKEMLKQKKISSNTVLLMEHMFSNPYITIPQAAIYLKTSYPTAKNAVMKLVNLGILQQINLVYKNKIFCAKEIEKTLQLD